MTAKDDETIEDIVIRQATQWQVRHHEGELTRDEQVAFAEWLRRSPQHVRQYLELQRFKGDLTAALARMPALEGTAAAVVRFQPRLETWPWFKSPVFGGALAMAGLLVLGLMHRMPEVARQTVTAAHGDQRTLTLADGSIVHLNSQSTLKVSYSKQERLIELTQGQALFNVAHDASRPFRVRAGSADVIAIGTEFDVYRKPSGLTVTVVDGKVEVVEQGRASEDPPVQLKAGEQLRLGSAVKAPRAEVVDVRTATAWTRREILFDQERLGDVAEEFNRYIAAPIELNDAGLRERRVSGIFNAYDVESFLDFLRQYNVEIERTPKVILVSKRTVQPTP